jgi:hypothetical protein
MFLNLDRGRQKRTAVTPAISDASEWSLAQLIHGLIRIVDAAIKHTKSSFHRILLYIVSCKASEMAAGRRGVFVRHKLNVYLMRLTER